MKIYRPKTFEDLMVTSAYMKGPQSEMYLQLLVDTGSTYTIISRRVLEKVGFSLTAPKERRFIVTGSREETLPIVYLDWFNCLGKHIEKFQVLAHTFPSRADRYIHGLLGMSFMKRFPIEIRTQSYEIIVRD